MRAGWRTVNLQQVPHFGVEAVRSQVVPADEHVLLLHRDPVLLEHRRQHLGHVVVAYKRVADPCQVRLCARLRGRCRGQPAPGSCGARFPRPTAGNRPETSATGRPAARGARPRERSACGTPGNGSARGGGEHAPTVVLHLRVADREPRVRPEQGLQASSAAAPPSSRKVSKSTEQQREARSRVRAP